MPHHHLATPARLEAFSDGVIAVIITIMVLELKVPHQNGIAGLHAVLPTLAVYAISFAFTGIYWINHHHLAHRTEQADEFVLYANLFFLFCLAPALLHLLRPGKKARLLLGLPLHRLDDLHRLQLPAPAPLHRPPPPPR